MTERKTYKHNICAAIFDGLTITEALEYAARLQEIYKDDHKNLRFELKYYDNDERTQLYLVGDREETDIEMRNRIAMGEEIKRRQEAKDRKEFERLKKLYEKD